MTLTEKKQRLAEIEWELFDKVNNEGGRAPCQDDPDTFFIMRRSQFAPWPEALTDAYMRDLTDGMQAGRNLVAEKYAWMMRKTAPEAFARIKDVLPVPEYETEVVIDAIVEIELRWFTAYAEKYPALARGNRPATAASGGVHGTSFETYLRGELHTYSPETLELYMEYVRSLLAGGKNLSVLVTDSIVRSYGYVDIDDAERRLSNINL